MDDAYSRRSSVQSWPRSDTSYPPSRASSALTDYSSSPSTGKRTTGAKRSRIPRQFQDVKALWRIVTHLYEKKSKSNGSQASQTLVTTYSPYGHNGTSPDTESPVPVRSPSTVHSHGFEYGNRHSPDEQEPFELAGVIPYNHAGNRTAPSPREAPRNAQLYNNRNNNPDAYHEGIFPPSHEGEAEAQRAYASMDTRGNGQRPAQREVAVPMHDNKNYTSGHQDLGFINTNPRLTLADEERIVRITASFNMYKNVQYADDAQRIGQVVGLNCNPMRMSGHYHHNTSMGRGSQQIGLIYCP